MIIELISTTEAAGILGVSRQRVQQMVDEGRLPRRLIGTVLVHDKAMIECLAATPEGVR